MTVMGVLNTLETICSVMEDQAEVCEMSVPVDVAAATAIMAV